jgi:type VI secretion system protein VasI
MNCYCRSLAAACLILFAGIATAQTKQLDGNWVITIGEDPSSYEVVTSLQQESANTIKDEYATKDVKPQLAFRCAPGNQEISVQLDWRRFISSFSTEVGFKVDGGKTLWFKWGVDQSNKITKSKSAADSQSLIDQLDAGSELLVEVSPYSESPVTVQFDLAGFSQALDALRGECQ